MTPDEIRSLLPLLREGEQVTMKELLERQAEYRSAHHLQPLTPGTIERRYGGFVETVGGLPVGWKAAHPSELDARIAALHARIDELEAGATS